MNREHQLGFHKHRDKHKHKHKLRDKNKHKHIGGFIKILNINQVSSNPKKNTNTQTNSRNTHILYLGKVLKKHIKS